MFCPKCRTEYKEGITVCADCGTPLVDKLPPKMPELSELVTVLSTGDLSSVALAKSILDEAGISYLAKGEYPMEQLAVGPVEIQVDRQDQAQARELLEGLAAGMEATGLIEQIPPDDEEPPKKQ
jgi:hypothetical protein